MESTKDTALSSKRCVNKIKSIANLKKIQFLAVNGIDNKLY